MTLFGRLKRAHDEDFQRGFGPNARERCRDAVSDRARYFALGTAGYRIRRFMTRREVFVLCVSVFSYGHVCVLLKLGVINPNIGFSASSLSTQTMYPQAI